MVIQKEKFDEYEKQAKETARKKLKELREANNLTPEELANIIHVSKSLIESLENGNRNITIENALQLAALYNVSLDYIYGLTQLLITQVY
ncbi:helix-turn-helix transcriptional regulator [Anaerocolumna chitinilytica]|uniref:HTH cro/C1-type domain-containing protein n=1 Tax=Anaerocolumna chitinilytica TaxID=1727145 RepID=A0A7I8DF72_9FIRM|nr:helix-turn-helix transcriptional regulator [Anaerocolumna chitinilytica]BCJ97050.1 hypothetical protein bsdcttw_00910 [Anaerocolumna chitinilytica]